MSDDSDDDIFGDGGSSDDTNELIASAKSTGAGATRKVTATKTKPTKRLKKKNDSFPGVCVFNLLHL